MSYLTRQSSSLDSFLRPEPSHVEVSYSSGSTAAVHANIRRPVREHHQLERQTRLSQQLHQLLILSSPWHAWFVRLGSTKVQRKRDCPLVNAPAGCPASTHIQNGQEKSYQELNCGFHAESGCHRLTLSLSVDHGEEHEVALDSRRACVAVGFAVRVVCTTTCHATEAPNS